MHLNVQKMQNSVEFWFVTKRIALQMDAIPYLTFQMEPCRLNHFVWLNPSLGSVSLPHMASRWNLSTSITTTHTMVLKLEFMNVYGLNSPYKKACHVERGKENERRSTFAFKRPISKLLKHQNALTNCFHKCSQLMPPYGGVLIATKTLAFHLHNLITDPQDRYIIMACNLSNISYTIVNPYGSNFWQISFLKSLLKKVSTVQQGFLLLCWDFNVIIDKSLDVFGGTPSTRTTLANPMKNANLYDSWRCLHASEKHFIYYSVTHKSYSGIWITWPY